MAHYGSAFQEEADSKRPDQYYYLVGTLSEDVLVALVNPGGQKHL